jgi:hypothetical protein
MVIEGIICLNLTELSQYRAQEWDFVNLVMNHWLPYRLGIFVPCEYRFLKEYCAHGIFYLFIWFVRLLALRPFLAYCASLG